MSAKKKGGGGQLTRSEVVTIRLDPKLKFGAELAARRQRRTVSSFIEWAIEQALANVRISYSENPEESLTAEQVVNRIWDVDQSDRFILLALYHPELLNHQEEVLWKRLIECEGLWKKKNLRDVTSAKFELIRDYWDLLNKVASGELTISDLPPETTEFKEESQED